jgi:hypothetical protein
MPDSAVLTFTDPDAYYATIRTAEVKGIVTVRGDYRAELTRIDLHRLWMQRGVEGLPRVMNVRRRDPRVALCFTTDQEQAPLHVGGMEPGRGEFAVLQRRVRSIRVRFGGSPSILSGLPMGSDVVDAGGSRRGRTSDRRAAK